MYVFGSAPNSFLHPQNILVFVLSSTCTSSPMTVSYLSAAFMFLNMPLLFFFFFFLGRLFFFELAGLAFPLVFGEYHKRFVGIVCRIHRSEEHTSELQSRQYL